MSDNDVNVKFGADFSELDSKMKASASSFSSATKSMTDQAIASYGKLTSSQQKFYAELDAEIEAERKAAAAAYALAEANNEVASTSDKAAHATTGQKREVMVMAHEIMTGNMSRVPGSFMVLMERTGGLTSAFSALGGMILNPIGATLALTAGAVGLVLAFDSARKAADELNNAINLTGNFSGKTAAGMQKLSSSVSASANVSIGDANAIGNALVRLGTIGAGAFDSVATSAAEYSRATGKTAEESADYMAKIFTDPKRGAEELNASMHFLTSAQMENIATMTRQGDVAGAQLVLSEALNKHISDDTDALRQQDGVLGAVSKAWSSFWNAATHSATAVDKLAAAKEHLQQMKSGGWGADEIAIAQQMVTTLNDEVEATNNLAAAKTKQSTAIAKQSAIDAELHKGKAYQVKELQDAIKLLEAGKQTNESLAREKELREEIAQIQKPKAIKSPKSDMSAWRTELAEKHDAESAFFASTLADDEKFWAAKLANAKKGTTDAIGSAHEVATLHKQIAIEQFNDEVGVMRNQESEAKAGSVERLVIANQVAAKIGEAYHYEGKQYIAAQREIATARKEFDAEEKKKASGEIASARDAATAEIDIAHEKLTALKITGDISAQEEIAGFKALEAKKYAISLDALQKQQALDALDQDATKKDLDAILKLQTNHEKDVIRLNGEAAKASQDAWNKALSPITAAFNTSITGMIMGTTTLQKAMQKITQSILGMFVQLGMDMVKQWATHELAKTSLTQAGTMSRKLLEAMGLAATVPAQAAASAATIAEKKVEAAAVIPAEAAIAAGGAASAVAAIPVVGPAMAVAAYASTMGMVMGGLAVASSAGGEWNVGSDRLNLVHKNETILPARIATPLRAMVENGSMGGDTHVHIHATDAQSVKNLIMQNGSAIMSAIKSQARGFNTKGMI